MSERSLLDALDRQQHNGTDPVDKVLFAEAAARIRELEAEVATAKESGYKSARDQFRNEAENYDSWVDFCESFCPGKAPEDMIQLAAKVLTAAAPHDPLTLIEAGKKPRLKLRLFAEWHDDDYDAIWLYFENDDEPPSAYIGSPLDCDWADETAHWDMGRVGWLPFSAIDYSASAESARAGEGGE